MLLCTAFSIYIHKIRYIWREMCNKLGQKSSFPPDIFGHNYDII